MTTKFQCPWQQCIKTTSLAERKALVPVTSSGDAALLHHMRLLKSLPGEVHWNDDAPVIPFLVSPVLYCGDFKGVGTDCLDLAKHYLLVCIAERHFGRSRTCDFASETMVRALSDSIRCISAANAVFNRQDLPSWAVQPLNTPFFESVLEAVVELCRAKRMKQPTAMTKKEEFERLIKCLLYVRDKIRMHPCNVSAFKKWTASLLIHVEQFILLAAGACLLNAGEYPFAPRADHESVPETAMRITNAIQCMRASKQADAFSLIADATELLESGYKRDVPGPPWLAKAILENDYWVHEKEATMAKIILSGDNVIDRAWKSIAV